MADREERAREEQAQLQDRQATAHEANERNLAQSYEEQERARHRSQPGRAGAQAELNRRRAIESWDKARARRTQTPDNLGPAFTVEAQGLEWRDRTEARADAIYLTESKAEAMCRKERPEAFVVLEQARHNPRCSMGQRPDEPTSQCSDTLSGARCGWKTK
jgi:hypothetical protein